MQRKYSIEITENEDDVQIVAKGDAPVTDENEATAYDLYVHVLRKQLIVLSQMVGGEVTPTNATKH